MLSYQPSADGVRPAPACAVVLGAVPSILTARDLNASVLPIVSIERYSTVWLPSAVMVNGAVYVVSVPPSMR